MARLQSSRAIACGTSGRARTFDPRIKNPLLYRLSYGSLIGAETLAISPMSCKLRFNCRLSLLDVGAHRRQTPPPRSVLGSPDKVHGGYSSVG